MLKAEKEFIDPKNLSFIFLNILIFIIVQILFFYYVASGQYEEVVVGLSSLPIAYLERAPLENLAREKKLTAFKHNGFWQSMDTLREKELLEKCLDLLSIIVTCNEHGFANTNKASTAPALAVDS